MEILHPQDNDLIRPVRATFDRQTGLVQVLLHKAHFGYVDKPIRYQGRRFKPKDELHITIISQDAPAVCKYLDSHPDDEHEIQDLVASTNWAYRKREEYYHIEEAPGVETIIQMVEVPQVNQFLRDLSRVIKQGLLLPPTHVTLYMRGTKKGISLPSQAAFDERVQAAVRLEELEPEEDRPGSPPPGPGAAG